MDYQTHILPNGLKIIHKHDDMAVTYCGVIINVGSRDENQDEEGMSHFIEHMLFKGTKKRRSTHIINRLENVGGELNAYTSKEETVVYAAVLSEYTERAIELIGDITLNSTFPQKEIEKEIVVIADEIQSYNDSPSELIFDEFEELLFENHPISHNILGKTEMLEKFTTESASAFHSKYYKPENMTFFSLGNIDFKRLIRWIEKYFHTENKSAEKTQRVAPIVFSTERHEIKKNTSQTHFIMGCPAYNLQHSDRMGMYLLNNILGGMGMNSWLNLSLREKHGLVYNVESVFQPMTDTGMWVIYFGSDSENASRCEKLIYNELQKLKDQKISESALNKYKLQLMGQLAIGTENKENLALSMGKSFMRFGKVDNIETLRKKINAVTAEQLQKIANEIFDNQKITVLKYI